MQLVKEANQGSLVKLSTRQPIVDRMFSFTVFPGAYDRIKRRDIRLEAVELLFEA